jgi:hypothetical protein
LAQVSGYDCIVYESGDLTGGLLSNGLDTGLNDKGNDVGLLQGWFDGPADRSILHFSENLSWFLGGIPAQGGSASASQQAYLSTVMGVNVLDGDVRNEIGGQSVPHILPLVPAFQSDFVANGACPALNHFDSIAPAVGAIAGHGYEQASAPGTTYTIGPGRAASVIWDRMANGHRKVSVTFPYGMSYVYGAPGKGSATALGMLLAEVFAVFGGHTPGEPVSSPPMRTVLALAAPVPNPFNPRTRIAFEVPASGRARLQIFNLRGGLVRTLVDGQLAAGPHTLDWNGEDELGRAVASGVYILRLSAEGGTRERKLALVR